MSPLASTSKWTLDYTSVPPPKITIQDPPGFVPSGSSKVANKAATTSSKGSAVNLDALRSQKAWEIALAPAKNVPMQAFMMYMTGGGIQVFSVMSVWFLLKQAVGGMMNVENVFAPFTAASRSKAVLASPASPAENETPRSFTQQKLVYLLCQLGLLAVGLWKLNSMGLLPTHESDWMAFPGSKFIGTLEFFGFMNTDIQPSGKMPVLLYAFYQSMFAALTPVIAVGGCAERARLAPILVVSFLWATIVYNVVACWTWSVTG